MGPVRISASTLHRPLPAPSLLPTPHPGVPCRTGCRPRVPPKLYDLVLWSKAPTHQHGPATLHSAVLVPDTLTLLNFYLNACPGHLSNSWHEVLPSFPPHSSGGVRTMRPRTGLQPLHSTTPVSCQQATRSPWASACPQ